MYAYSRFARSGIAHALRTFMLSLAILGFAASIPAATVASWTDSTLNVNASVNAATGTGVLSRGAGVAFTSDANTYSSSQWNTGTEANAVTGNDYVQITVNTTGYGNLTLNFTHSGNNQRPTNGRVYYSSTGTGGTFTGANTFVPLNGTNTAEAFNLSAITALNNNANVVFRIFGWNAANVNGRLRISGISITGTDDPNISVPATLAFGTITASTTLDQNLVVTSNGPSQTLTVANTSSITGADAAKFSIQTALPFNVTSGSTANLVVRFNPAGAVGTFNATLNVASNDINNPTVSVALSGTSVIPDINPTPTSLTFANRDVDAGASAGQSVTISNIGAGSLIFSGAQVAIVGGGASQFAISADSGEATVASGGNRSVTVVFNPSTTGVQSANLRITSNDPDEATVDIPLSGTGTDQEIDISPTSLSYADRDSDAGASASQSVTITNIGTNTLSFTGAQVAVSGADFTITGDTAEATLAPGASRTVQVAFDPASAGAKSQSLVITSDDTDEATSNVSLAGTGIDQEIDVAPTSLSFAGRDIDAGPSASQSVTITNTGTNTLNFTGAQVAISGTDFSITSDTGEASLVPGASRTVQVDFDPSATGALSGSLTITSDDTNEATVNVLLAGTGLDQEIDTTPGSVSFGNHDIDSGVSSPQNLTITNTGTSTLTFTGPQVALVGADFAISSDSGEPSLAPGASRTIQITFDPSTTGSKTGSITITSDDTDEPTLIVSIAGTGTDQDIDVSPGSLTFAAHDIDAGGSAAQTVTITNSGDATLAFTGAQVAVSGSDFAISSDSGQASLAPGASRTVQITFNPSVTGTRTGSLTITSDDSDEASVVVSLGGDGIDQEIDASPAALSFGDEDIDSGPTTPLDVTISNLGDNTLTFTGAQVAITGADAASFGISADSGEATLAPAGTRTISVTFDPSTTGAKTANLVITSDDTDEPSVSIPLSGNAVNQQLVVTGGPLGFGSHDIDAGATAAQDITITNSGGSTLNFTGAGIAIAGADAADFAFVGAPSIAPLAPAASRIVSVQFDPSVIGTKTATIEITSNGGDTSVGLSGTGTDQEIDVAPASLSFANRDVDAGASAPLTVTVTNLGTATLAFTGAQVALAGTGFAISSDSGEATLAPSASRVIDITFDPTTASAHSGSVTITSDDTDEPSVAVLLSGTGIDQEVTVSPASLNFGNQDVDEGATGTLAITITNDGTNTLNFTGAGVALTGSDFAITSDSGESTLAPGASRTLDIIFDPASTGAKSGTLTVTTDDTDEPSVGVSLAGMGVDQEIDATPATLSFGSRDTDAGVSLAQSVTITNTGSNTLSFTGAQIAISGGDFAIDSDSGEASLAPNASRTVGITFDPSTAGAKSGTLTITTDDTDEPTVTIDLDGTGIDQEVSIAPLTLSFGSRDVDAGASALQSVTITNSGTNTLNFTGAQVALAGADFALSSDSGEALLAPGASRTVDLTFDPSAAGAITGTLTITTDDADEPTINVDLDGTGLDQEIDVTPVSHGFGSIDVDAGASSFVAITITNAGTNTLTFTGAQVALGGADPSQFAITGDTGEASLAPGTTRIVDVAFNPSTTGGKSASLTITSDDTSEPSVSLSLTGTGVDQEVDVAPLSHTFADRDVDGGPSAPFAITISNTGTNTLTFTGPGVFLTGSDFLIASDSGEPSLAPGASRTVQVQFDPSASGAASGSLAVTTDDSDEPSVNVTLDGTGIDQEIGVSPGSLSFGDRDIDAGASSPLPVTITNSGTTTLNFTGTQIALSGAEFSISNDSGEATLAPGASRTVQIVFDPSSTGVKSGSLTITSDDSDESSVVVSLDGTGIEQEIDLNTLSLSYAARDVDAGPSTPQPIQITNTGTATLTFTGAQVSLSGSDFVIQSDSGQASLAPGATRLIQLRFDPAAAGARSGSLTITTDDTDEPSVVVALSGDGIDQEIDATPVSLLFGDQDIDAGVSSPLSVIISNLGTNTLAFTGAEVTVAGADAASFAISSDSGEATLAPGATRTVSVTFDPSTTGAKSASLVITSDDTSEPSVSIPLTGNAVDQQLIVTGGPLGFGNQDIDAGATSTMSVTVTNSGGSTLNFTGAGIVLAGTDATAFAFAPAPSIAPLAPGANRNISLQFDPSTLGAKTATIEITSDGGNSSVGLSGSGTDQEIEVSPASLTFADRDVDAGASAPQTLTISNLGTHTLTFTGAQIALSGSDFAISSDSGQATLAPGASRVLGVTFSPSATGPDSGSITITSDDTDEPSVVISLDGIGIDQEVTVSPLSLDFGDQDIDEGATAVQTVTITNNGTSILNFTGAGVDLAGSDFAIANDSGEPTLAPGASRTIGLNYDPSITGAMNGTLTITTDDTDEPSIVVSLAGVGADQEIGVAPPSLAFGGRDPDLGPSAGLTVTISNTGLMPLHLTGAQVALAGADFAIATDTGEATIAPGMSRTLTITFDPSTVGAKAGTLTITSDDSDEPTIVVSLTGTGTQREINVVPASLDFGERTVGSGPSALRLVSVANIGTGTLGFTGAGIEIVGADATDFSIANIPAVTPMGPGQDRTILLAFEPLTTGPKTAALRITTDDLDEPTIDIPLTGTGTGAGEPGQNGVSSSWKFYE